MSGPLDFDILIRDSEFERQITRIENRVMGMSRKVVKETNAIDEQFKRLALAATGLFTFGQLSQLPMQIVKVRGEFQQLEIAFTTMLRSKAKADQLMSEIVEAAATTPFGLKDVASGAKQLLAYGSNAQTVVKEIKMLGDVASGVSAPLNDIIYLYGTLRSQGRAYAVDIRQFAGRGIPIYAELAKVLKVNVDQVNDLVSAGKVGFPEVQKAFRNMTAEGGMFQNLMEKQSQSLPGLIERLSDAFDVMFNNIGKANEGAIGAIITGATEMVEHYQPVLDTLGVLVATYGAYKAAVVVAMVAEQASAIGKNIQLWWTYAKSIQSATDAQTLFNLTTGMNPYAVAAAALIGLIAAVALYNREVSAAEQAETLMREAREKALDTTTAELAKIELLQKQINDESKSRELRNQKLQELIAISPDHLKALTLDSVKTLEGRDAIEAYIDSKRRQLELQQLEKEYIDSRTREEAAKQGRSELTTLQKLQIAGTQLLNGAVLQGANNGADVASLVANENNAIANREKEIQAKIRERITVTQDADKATQTADANAQAGAKKTVAWYDEQIKKLKEDQELSVGRAQYDKYQKQIDAMTKSRNRITGTQTAAEKKAAKEADKVGPFGSLSYWDNVAKKADEVLQKLPETDKGKIAQQLAIKADAEQRADEIRKAQTIRTFDEELEERKKQYELYTKWVQFVDQDSADTRYADLLSKGRTYVDYLNKEIARLEAKQKDGTLTKKEGDNLLLLNTQRDEATGKKTAIQVFSDNLQTARDKAASLTDYLASLQAQQDELQGNNTDFGLEARRIVAEEIVQAQRQRREQLQQFLQDVVGSEQQQTTTRKRYADLRVELDKQYTDKKSSAYQKALSDINKAEENDLKEVRERAAQARDEFKKLDDVIVERGRAALRKRLELLKEYLRTASDEEKKSQTFIGKQKEADDLTIEIDKFTLDDVRTFASIAGELGDALSTVNGNLGQTGQLMSGLAQSANLVTVAFDKNAETSDKIAAGAQGLVGLFNILISSAAQRDQAEQQYARNRIAAQQQYNVLLNDQIGLQSELNESVFIKNYQGRLKDGVSKLNEANKAYQASIAKLSEGRAKVGQRDAIDAGNIGKGIGSGAAVGAAVGSIVPVIGTAIGAVAGGIVGGLVGLFGGKKKQDEFGSLMQQYPDLVKKGADGWEELDENLAATLIDQEQVDENTKQLLQNTIEWQKQMQEAKEQITSIIQELAGGLGDSLRDNLVESFRTGEDAAIAFGDSVGKVIEDMISKLLFSQIFQAEFDKLEKEMQASMNGGDGDWVDDIARFYETNAANVQKFQDDLSKAQKEAKDKYGLDIFKSSDDPVSKKNTALSGAVKGVSEETAGIVAGQLNAMRISQAETQNLIRSQLMALNRIADNTDYCKHLESIDDSLQQIKETNPLRSKGIPG